MAKPKRDDMEKMLFQEIQKVFLSGRTTIEERKEICELWLNGDSDCYKQLAEQRNLIPIALICGALIDIEHPVFCPGGNLATRSVIGLAALVFRIEIIRSVLNMRMSADLTSETARSILYPVEPCG